MNELQAVASHLCASKCGGVLATLVSVEGSSYRRPGARMLVPRRGRRIGSISGGCLEEDVIAHAKKVAAAGQPLLVVYDTAAENDLIWGVGMGCHGVVRVLLEPLPALPDWAIRLRDNLRAGAPTDIAVVWSGPPESMGTRLGPAGELGGVFAEHVEPAPSLTVYGAGDDARPLVSLALELGWTVTVADSRRTMATRSRFPGASCLVVGPPEELVARSAPRPGSLAVVMTHRYSHDVPILRDLLPLPVSYLGLLGPRMRAERIFGELEKEGMVLTAEIRGRLRAPVGLDLGAEGAQEVALSIVAEMKAALSGRDGRPLRERTLPIHA